MKGLRLSIVLLRSNGLVRCASVHQTASRLTTTLHPAERRYKSNGFNRGKPGSKEWSEKESLQKETRHAKKLAKNGSATAGGSSSSKNSDARPQPNAEEPFDMADLEYTWARAAEKHEAILKQLRSGGRFTPEVLGAIPVRPDRKSPETFPLRDLASVVPPTSGRRWSILCFDKASKAAIKSAFQNSPKFNQQPQDSPDNEAELIVLVEPEKTDDLERKIKEVCHAWREAIRAGRSARDKVHKTWKAGRLIVKDDLTKLEKTLQTMQDAKMAEVKTKEAEALRQLKARGS